MPYYVSKPALFQQEYKCQLIHVSNLLCLTHVIATVNLLHLGELFY